MKTRLILLVFLISFITMESCHRRVVNNPYLKMKEKPSTQLKRADAEEMAKEKKENTKAEKKAARERKRQDRKFFKKRFHLHLHKRKKEDQQKGQF